MRRLIWPLPVRVLHWLLAAGVIAAFATHEMDGIWHDGPGYVALFAALIRLAWGLGPATHQAPVRYRRFANFLLSPTQTWRFLRSLLRLQYARHLGHNPVAAYLVLGLLLVSALAGLSGWLLTTDAFFGNAWMMQAHDAFGHAIVPLVLLHWLLLALSAWRHGDNPLTVMWHGHKNTGTPQTSNPRSETVNSGDAAPPAR